METHTAIEKLRKLSHKLWSSISHETKILIAIQWGWRACDAFFSWATCQDFSTIWQSTRCPLCSSSSTQPLSHCHSVSGFRISASDTRTLSFSSLGSARSSSPICFWTSDGWPRPANPSPVDDALCCCCWLWLCKERTQARKACPSWRTRADWLAGELAGSAYSLTHSLTRTDGRRGRAVHSLLRLRPATLFCIERLRLFNLPSQFRCEYFIQGLVTNNPPHLARMMDCTVIQFFWT